MKKLNLLVVLCSLWAPFVYAASKPATLPKGYHLLYSQKFLRRSALKDFVMTDPKAWELTKVDGRNTLDLVTQSTYLPPARSPLNIALLADRVFGDFVMEAEVQSTKPDYPHRDMCLFFDVISPAQFYYAHIASTADPHAHNIFIVNEAPRTNIATLVSSNGVKWGATNEWHKVRLERNGTEGTIKVYFDDFSKPILAAQDKTFASGFIGFGSFDDTGRFANIKIWGPSMTKKKTTFFQRPPTK